MLHSTPTRALRAFSLLATLPFVLAACLFTAKPLLDETNSVPGADSPELKTFIEVSRTYDGREGPDPNEAPVPLFTPPPEGEDLSDIRVTPLTGGMLLIQEELRDCEMDYCFVYYGARVREDGLPELCLVDTEAKEALFAAAPDQGVTLTEMETEEDKFHLPPDIAMDGPPENLMAFLLAQFAEDRLSCSSPED